MAKTRPSTGRRDTHETVVTPADTTQDSSGFQKCFYNLWGREGDKIWEPVPNEDLVGSIVEDTGRQDWRKLRPFDLLPDLDRTRGGVAHQLLYVGEKLRVACSSITGPQETFERAGDYETIFFQFSGIALVETSFGRHEIRPGEMLYIPAMVAHRTIGSPNCRRMEYYPKDPIQVMLDPNRPLAESQFSVSRLGDEKLTEQLPQSVAVANGKIRERLTHWDNLPGEAFLFERTYDWMVGKAESGPKPIKVRPFDYMVTDGRGVRTAMLWKSPTFRQQVYANPGRQPAPHRGYDEDEYWFQFSGRVDQETEHAAYPIEAGECSMAEAGISHTSTSHPGANRLTSYTNKPLRMATDPSQHLRASRWEVRPIE
jgi:mannose-6-phosphate isomerase-like protein (cupin superfamily)